MTEKQIDQVVARLRTLSIMDMHTVCERMDRDLIGRAVLKTFVQVVTETVNGPRAVPADTSVSVVSKVDRPKAVAP